MSHAGSIKRAAGVLKSFSLAIFPEYSVTAGIDIEAIEEMADTGNLSDDLTDLLVALGKAVHTSQLRPPAGAGLIRENKRS
jgi:hypothetical protein